MLWVLAALACVLLTDDGAPTNAHLGPSGDDSGARDADGDGYDASVDCDDLDRDVHPGTKETCDNGRDDNCNGTADGCDWSGELVLEGTEIRTSDDESAIGTTLAVCDANGDGVGDVVLGAPGYSNETGAAYVFYGPIRDDRDVKDADYALMGTEKDFHTGWSVDCRRDVDGDGVADIIVGQPGRMFGHYGAGTVYLVSGGGTGRRPIADEASSTWIGSDPSDRLGYQVVAMDADGDETDELAVTIPATNTGPHGFGATYVFVDAAPGARDAETAAAYIYGDAPNDLLKGTAGNAGDLDGDGLEDLVLTGWDHELEEVLVFAAPFAGDVPKSDADIRIVGGASNVRWSGIGHADLDGDGRDDLFVGNRAHDADDGAAYAFFAPIARDTEPASADLRILGPMSEHDGAGSDVTAPGDVDGDGSQDLLIGASDGGIVYLQHGGDRGLYQLEKTAQAWWYAKDSRSGAGTTVAAGDVTGDGVVEFLIGSPGDGDVDEGSITIVPSFQL